MQNMFRKHGLIRRLAALFTAVLLLTSEAQVFLQAPIYAAAADTEVVAEQSGDESDTPATEEGTDPGADVPAISQDEADAEGLTLTVSEVQYGEDGSNTKGNLDVLFAPVLSVAGVKLVKDTDYTVSYKFFDDAEAAAAVDEESFDDAEGIELSGVKAGTELTVVALAKIGGIRYITSESFTVAKRKVTVSYNAGEDAAVNGRDIADDGSLTLPANAIDYSALSFTAGEGYVLDLPEAEEAVEGDLVFDMSGVDVSEDGTWTVPMELTMSPDFQANYEIVGNIFGQLYVLKAHYYVTFTANNDGKVFTKTYEFPDYNFSGTAAKLLEKLGKTDEVFAKEGSRYTLGGFLEDDAYLVGWTVYTDGLNKSGDYYAENDSVVFVNADGSTYEANYSSTPKEFVLSGKKDYHFVAQLNKSAAKNIIVSAIPAVYYDGRAHEALGTKANDKKVSRDLRIVAYHSWGAESVSNRLYAGTDYTVTYKNNTAASMTLSENGVYVPKWTNDSERPTVIVTGKGTYNGFTATVYFEILPQNLGDYEYSYKYIDPSNDNSDGFDWDSPYRYFYSSQAQIGGFTAHTYLLKNGKLSTRITPKVTKTIYSDDSSYNTKRTYTTLNLSSGIDYEPALYKWDSDKNCWVQEADSDPNKITAAGDYLYMIRGVGNFCGAVFGSGDKNSFYDGSDSTKGAANPSHSVTNTYQFRVTDTQDYDMAYAKVKIGTKSIKWDGNKHGATDFKITVKNKSGKELVLGTDYDVSFSSRYSNANGVSGGSEVSASNEYYVRVYGIGEYYNSKRPGNVKIKGMKLAAKYVKLDSKTAEWGQFPKVELTSAGTAAKLNLSDSSDPYYIGQSSYVNKGYSTYSGTKMTTIVGGSWYGRAGQAIEPTSYVKLAWTRKAMTVQQAIDAGWMSFTVSDNGLYTVKGTMPDKISMVSGHENRSFTGENLYTSYRYGCSVYDASKNYLGYEYFTFSFKNNTKLGGKATVTVKADGRVITGSAAIGTYTVNTRPVSYIPHVNNYTPSPYDYSAGQVYAVITDAQKGKGKLDKPNVKLYQTYRDNKGNKKSAPLSAKQYTVLKGDDVGGAGIATRVLVANGSAKEYNFLYDAEDNGLDCGIFALYAKKLSVKDIVSVHFGSEDFTVKNGVAQGLAGVFTGNSVNLQIDQFKVKETVLELGMDYNGIWGQNITAGTNTASFILRPHYNMTNDTYEYGGNAVIKYSITPAEGVTL